MGDDRRKVCTKCGEEKPLADFYASPGARDGVRGDCKVCFRARAAARYRADPAPVRERARRWNQENRERYEARMREYKESGKKKVSDRRSYLKRTYNMTLEEYDVLLASQGGGCAICGRPPRDDIALHVDHCHVSGVVRGLLCFRCNNALGDFDHDAGLLQAAADYLAVSEDELARRRVRALTGTTPAPR